ncbi:hypothetical protein SO694_00047157 [Aureococcus anophagefferens]|uniref:USP domain-containing protein n=1 Tax=Aureococcus anophagefferens TaxID=44056 RepID=A0ABR1G8I7_AURAN
MPGSGGDFDVGVQWLGADEDVLTDGLLDRLTSHVRSGRTVQSFADALFEKHGDQINLSGDNLRDKIVAYREPLDSDDELDSVPVELDDVVTETSLFILRPRIPEADARLLVMHARLHEETTRFDVLGLISAQRAGDSNSNCYELAIHLARKKDATRSLTELGAQDLDFFVASEYSAQATESLMPALERDYHGGLLERVNALASISEVVDPRRGRRKCHVLLVERPQVRLRIEVTQPGVQTEELSLHVSPESFVNTKAMITREKSILNGSALAIVKDWLEVMEDVSSEQSYEPGLELLRLLFAAGAPESVLETVQFAVVVDDGDPIRIDDLDESLNLVKSESAPSKVTMVLIYDSPDADGAGSDRCLLMLCVGPKGSVARKFFEIDDALLETTQAELACRTIAGAQEGAPGLRAEDVLKGSVFRISAHYAKLREASERERFASDLADQFGISERLKGTTLTLANGTLREALQPLKSSRFIVCHVSCAAQTQADQDMAHHPHLAVAHLLFTYWLLKGDGLKMTMFGVPTTYKAARLDAEDDEDVARTLSFAILTELDFSDYDADSEASARRAIEDLAYLWAGEVPKAVPHLEAAAAAGNALAATVVALLGERHPSQKLARKYDLTSFGAPFLELLPRDLRDLEQVISKYPVAQRKARGPDRAPEASRKEDAPREEEAPRSKADVDKEVEEAMDKLEDVFVDAVAPAPASKKNAKKKAKKKAKAKEARKAAETSGPAREIVRADANSDSDDSFKSALCDTPTAQSPVARPAEPPLLAPADDADSEDWVDVSAARRGKGPEARRGPPAAPPPPPRVPSPPPPPSPPSPAGAGGLLPALKRFAETRRRRRQRVHRAPRPRARRDWRADAAARGAPAFDGAYDDDDDFVVPEGLVDVERRSNCSLDAIVAVLHRCATFRGAFRPRALVGVAKDRRQDHLRVVDALDAALSAGDAGDVDAAIDGLRVALGAVEGGRGDLSTSGAHLDVAEVFEALLEALLACKGTRAAEAARAFRASGLISDAPCAACRAKATTTPRDFEDLARAATAFTLADAARRGDSLEAAFRDAHAACAKSCDHCKAPGSIDVLVSIHDTPKALALSVAWFTSTPAPADVEGVLRLAHKPLDGAAVFRPPKPGAKRLGLFAVVVFRDAHYTALVRDERADSWTWHDRRDATPVGSFESVVAKCRNDGGAPLCPYLLFFDA